ncbi:DNA methyltransferase [Mesorhizobium sp. BH1-1-4]|uniref:DNA methyltransferase n=1 Tax=Mesorhizobium sp. BH1-1-4 TaxID=2876662 RepID=UPI001CD17CB5|nr:DNA methyltransferase [Mesorhizobium sp. BH1-1-4]MBZ9993156.1 site-specific DNA-methyltransferase [Mesorhizobium sp. BH1-1-4]
MNELHFGDNLDVLRAMPSQSVDLIYLDPPFNSNANYNVLYGTKGGGASKAQSHAFEDTWTWGLDAQRALNETAERHLEAGALLDAFQKVFAGSTMMAYLSMMTVRLIEMQRILKSTGALYLHCDPTASHYLTIFLDAIFGTNNFRSEVIWKRSSAHSSSKRYSPVHDTIHFYSKSEKFTWNPAFQPIPQETIDAWYNNIEPGTGRRFNRADLTAAGQRNGSSGLPWRGIDPTSKGRHWAIPGYVGLAAIPAQEALEILDQQGRLYWPKKANGIPMFKRSS